MLDLEDVQGMIEEIESYVSHSIWICRNDVSSFPKMALCARSISRIGWMRIS